MPLPAPVEALWNDLWHNGVHLEQLRGVKAAPGFPAA
jgi:hypothetical protein